MVGLIWLKGAGFLEGSVKRTRSFYLYNSKLALKGDRGSLFLNLYTREGSLYALDEPVLLK